MEIKEAIFSSISELSTQNDEINESGKDSQNLKVDIKECDTNQAKYNEVETLLKLKERSLILFEGLRRDSNTNAQLKLEMIINYLEYQLCVIEERLDEING